MRSSAPHAVCACWRPGHTAPTRRRPRKTGAASLPAAIEGSLHPQPLIQPPRSGRRPDPLPPVHVRRTGADLGRLGVLDGKILEQRRPETRDRLRYEPRALGLVRRSTSLVGEGACTHHRGRHLDKVGRHLDALGDLQLEDVAANVLDHKIPRPVSHPPPVSKVRRAAGPWVARLSPYVLERLLELFDVVVAAAEDAGDPVLDGVVLGVCPDPRYDVAWPCAPRRPCQRPSRVS